MLKVMPWPWLSVSKQIWVRSFKWGIVHPCRSRGYKNIRIQGWRSKKIYRISRAWVHQSRIWLSRQFLIDLQLWPLIFLQPLDLQERTVPHLKYLINICLETESQGHGMTFKVIYVHSKYPYFISYRGLC